MWNRYGFFLLVLGLIAGCTRGVNNKTPEGALESYVNAAFSVKQESDKEKLLSLSIGEARIQLESMSDEDFMARFGKGKLHLVGLKMKDRRSELDGGVSLVYELVYREGAPDSGPVTHKKIAYLKKDSDESGWMVRGTKNIKEFVEQNEPMVIELTK